MHRFDATVVFTIGSCGYNSIHNTAKQDTAVIDNSEFNCFYTETCQKIVLEKSFLVFSF